MEGNKRFEGLSIHGSLPLILSILEGKVAFSTVKAGGDDEETGFARPGWSFGNLLQMQTALKKGRMKASIRWLRLIWLWLKARKNGKFVICQVGGNWCHGA